MAIKTFTTGEVLTAADTNTYLANSGLVFVKSQAVTGGAGVSSVTVSSAFSSTYDNYLVYYTGGSMTLNGSLNMQLGSSTTGYFGFLVYGDSSSNTVFGAGRSNQASMFWLGGTSGNGQWASLRAELFNPYLAAYTRFTNGIYADGNAYGLMNGEHKVPTSYDNFTIFAPVGNMSGGTIYVYGYRKG